MKMRMRTIFLMLGAVSVIVILSIVLTRFQPKTVLHESPQHHLPKGVKLRIGKGHVNDIEYSPNGTVLAVATSIGIWIYDASTDEVHTLLTGDNYGILSISFSPDGQTLAGGGPDRIVYLWNVATGKREQSFVGHTSGVFNVLFSRDGNTLVSTDIHDTNLWDISTGTHKKTIERHIPLGNTLWLNGEEVRLASKSYDDIRLSDLITEDEEKLLKGHTNPVKSLSFSPDGQTLAVEVSTQPFVYGMSLLEHIRKRLRVIRKALIA